MADRGFQIREDLPFHYCILVVKTSARVKRQMTKSEFKETKELANLRKNNKSRKGTLPVTMIQHADAKILTFAALCNLKAKIFIIN